jgi:hypothetical protein
MLTKEQLVEISNKFTLSKEIEEICFVIGKKMKESAHSGLRTFQIECIKPKGHSMTCGANGQNYHYVFVKDGHSINQYSDKIIECLMKNGFTYGDIESAAITNDYYSSIQLTVRW